MSDNGQKAPIYPRSKTLRLGIVGGLFALALVTGFTAWRLFSLPASAGELPASASALLAATPLPPSASPSATLTATQGTLQPVLIPTLVPSETMLAQAVPTEPAPQASSSGPLGLSESTIKGLIVLAIDEGMYAHLFAYSPGEMPLTRLDGGAWDDIHPALDPDGTRLAFASNRDGDWDLYWMDLKTGAVSQITDTPEYDASPSWSPDGLWLAYESYIPAGDGGDLEIFIRPLDEAQAPIRLTEDPASDHSPAWSPQGRKLAFISTRSGDSEVWLADLDQIEDRFTNLSRDAQVVEAHPSWSPDGQKLAWASTPEGGFQELKIWDTTHPDDPPRSLNSGDWSAWSPAGDSLLVTVATPNQTHLAGYYLDGTLALPMINLPEAAYGLAWGRDRLPDPLPETLAFQAMLTPTPLWQPVLVNAPDLPLGRVQVVQLEGVQAKLPVLQDRVDEGFYALKARTAERTGWDFLASLEQAYIPLTAPLNPGLMEDWLYTGRAFRFNTAPMSAGWLHVMREDFGAQTYWRVYLRARFQDGSQGAPLKDLPWDLAARLSGDPVAYEQGGRLAPAVPPGYWVDFTRLAASLGWERLPSLSTWRVAYSGVRYDEFVLREGRDWMSAMLELYPKAALDTPTPVSSPTMTATPTDTPTSTPTYTRTPYRSPTPTVTWTRRPTRTPTPSNTPRPTRTPTPAAASISLSATPAIVAFMEWQP